MPESVPETLARRYVSWLGNPDASPDEMVKIVSVDFLDHVSGSTGPAIWSVVAEWSRTSFADVHVEVHEIMTRGDRVMVWFTLNGRHIGDGFPRLRGIPVTGQRVSWPQVHLFRVDDERLVEHWAVRDDYALVEAVAGRPLAGPTTEDRSQP
jgi:predicted ester cyclase